eukprot:m.64938 g.64938  ORF g.64938 m.64938 type:complete len:275 (+) comp23499_c0_seq1:275-1099(+)
MSQRLFLISKQDCVEADEAENNEFGLTSSVTLTKPAAQRLTNQFEAQILAGCLSLVGLVDGPIGHAVISKQPNTCESNPTQLIDTATGEDGNAEPSLKLQLELYQNPPKPSSVTLIVALCRRKVLGRVLQTSVAVGVKHIHIIDSARTEAKYWVSHATDKDTIDAKVRAGLENARDSRWPTVTVWRDQIEFVNEGLPKLMTAGSLNFIAHPSPTAQECPTGVTTACNLLIGPEGGFITSEVECFKQKGFVDLSLGPRILPVETAVHVLLGKLCF